MLLKDKMSIGSDETAPELSGRLAPLGAQLLLEAIRQIQNGSVHREKQNDVEATYAPILKKEDGRINWLRPAVEIYDRLRGFTLWPGAYTTFRGEPLLLARAKPAGHSDMPPGVLKIDQRRLFAGCGANSALELLEVQPAGKKRMSTDAFLNGYRVASAEKLGDQN
jgi:methionyl-tRNA formyltransferase